MKSVTIFRLNHNRKYATFVSVDHGMVKVLFEPVVLFGRVENSMFSTNEPQIIEALKKHREYGSLFFIQEEGHAQEASGESKTPETDDLRSLLLEPDNAIEIATVTSVQMAKNWLQQNHGCVFESTRVRDIKIEAAQKYNVIFVNW